MVELKNKTIRYLARGIVLLAFLSNFLRGQTILDSIDAFYQKKEICYQFTEVRHLSNDKGIVTYNGQLLATTPYDSTFYIIEFEIPELEVKCEAIKQEFYYGRNDYVRKHFKDYKIKRDGAHYFYDGHTPGHIIVRGDNSLINQMPDSGILKIKRDKDFYYVSYADTMINETNIKGLTRRWIKEYKINKQDYSIVYSRSEEIFTGSNAELRNVSEFTYTYTCKNGDSLMKRLKNFVPMQLAAPPQMAQPGNHNLPDYITIFPAFHLKDTAGSMISDKDIQSRLVFVDFWYKGCAPCLANMSNLSQITSNFSSEDVQVLVINARDSLDNDIKRMIDKFNNGSRFLFGGGLLYKELHGRAFPMAIIYDNQTKKIIFSKPGASSESTALMVDLMRDYIRLNKN
ncbi:hypothetical protein CNR22_10340 [Sphingobacteriaceae bacterium]|nr:hypothetical protein CNR22_10340 [Sphingobacteriaceae bacterium]